MTASQIAKSRRQLLAAVSALGVSLGMGGVASADQASVKSKQSSAKSQTGAIRGESLDKVHAGKIDRPVNPGPQTSVKVTPNASPASSVGGSDQPPRP